MKDIVFVDARVYDYPSLASAIESEAKVIILDSTRDGVEQMTQILASCTDIETIHILYKSEKRSVQLGLTQLHTDNLETYTNHLQKWSAALTDNASIILYDCNIMSDGVEERFMEKISKTTGANVTEPSEIMDGFQLGVDGYLEQQLDMDSSYLMNLLSPPKINKEPVLSTPGFYW